MQQQNSQQNSDQAKSPIWKLAIAGSLAGIANGFLGTGGGSLLVPLFTSWLKLDERKAFATSVSVILPLSIISAITYYFKGAMDFTTAIPYLWGGLAGGIISGIVFKKIPTNILKRVFGILLVYGGIRALLAI